MQCTDRRPFRRIEVAIGNREITHIVDTRRGVVYINRAARGGANIVKLIFARRADARAGA